MEGECCCINNYNRRGNLIFLLHDCGRKQIGNLVILRTVKKISVGSIGIILVCGIVRFVVRNEIWCLACSIILSIVVYIVIEIILNNEVIGDFFLNITKNRGE